MYVVSNDILLLLLRYWFQYVIESKRLKGPMTNNMKSDYVSSFVIFCIRTRRVYPLGHNDPVLRVASHFSVSCRSLSHLRLFDRIFCSLLSRSKIRTWVQDL